MQGKTCDAYLQYWAKGSRDTMYTPFRAGTKDHKLYITATRARTNYKFRVVTVKDAEHINSKTYAFETQPIYQATPYFTLEESDPSIQEDLKNKFFLTQILTEPGSVVIIDNNGEIVWYEPFQKGVKVSHWTKDKTYFVLLGPKKYLPLVAMK
jgi:arylsulfate sulfotransferase